MGLLGNLMSFSHPTKSALPASHPLMRKIVSTLGYDVTGTRDYELRLVPAVNGAIEYFDRQIAAIPGGLAVSADSYGYDPVLRALFPAVDDIRLALGRSIEVKQALQSRTISSTDHIHALMGMRYRPVEHGEGQPLMFADHTLRGLAVTEEASRAGLREAALTRLLTNFGEHVGKLQHKQKLLRVEWNIENKKVVDTASLGDDDFVYAGKELLPENMLRGLIAWLEAPEEHLRVRAGEHEAPPAHTTAQQPLPHRLPVMHTADRRQWIVCLIKVPTREAIDAINIEKRNHRYIFI